MSLSTYGELKSSIAARGVRTDLTALIPEFVRAAHDIIVAKLSLCSMLTVTGETAALPTGARDVSVVVLDGLPAAPLALASEAQMTGLGAGTPGYFRVSGTDLVLAPAPSAALTARILHKLARTPFSADADVNLALERYPFLYLNGAMAELFGHTRDADQEAKYRALFVDGVATANETELEDLYAQATLQPRSQGVTY